jgi:hypothetical protein
MRSARTRFYASHTREAHPSFIGRPNEPKKSNVQGIEEIRAWEEGNADAKLSPEDLRWAQELDWEAEAIVEGKGRMLGIGVDGDVGDKHGTRYGGRVGFCALLKCEGNDGNGPLNLDVNARITLEKPMMRGSCLFTRVWGSHRFLRLKLSKPLLNRVSRDQSGRLVKELKEFCARPIHILGREYHPLVEKENTVYYFLHGRDRIGLKAVEDAGGDRKESYGMGKHIGTVEGLVQWWLAPEHNRQPGHVQIDHSTSPWSIRHAPWRVHQTRECQDYSGHQYVPSSLFYPGSGRIDHHFYRAQ